MLLALRRDLLLRRLRLSFLRLLTPPDPVHQEQCGERAFLRLSGDLGRLLQDRDGVLLCLAFFRLMGPAEGERL